MPQLPLHFPLSTGDLPAVALELETTPLVQALKRVAAQGGKSEWVRFQFTLGILSISCGAAHCEIRAAGQWPQVVSVTRSWISAVLASELPRDITILRVENGKLFAHEIGVQCFTGDDALSSEELARRDKHVRAATAALKRYGVMMEEIESLVKDVGAEAAGLWGPNDDRIIADVAAAWQCLASYGVETSAIRRLLNRKSRDLWKAGNSQLKT